MNARRMKRLPCPFCGTDDSVIEDRMSNYDNDDLNSVVCMKCDAVGPMQKTIVGAVRKWNERKAT